MAAPKGALAKWSHMKLVGVLAIWQLIMIIIYGVKVRYDPAADAKTKGHHKESGNDVNNYYGLFQDVHIMVFVGFGFLMTFLRRYGYSAVGYNFLIAALAIEFSYVLKCAFHHGEFEHTDVKDLVTSDFVAATVLISFGAVLGKTSPLQLVIMVIIEVVFVVLNEWIAVEHLKAVDVGGSMFIHAFGAYFGLAVARMLYDEGHHENPKESAGYNSNLFAMIGTLFLWICWPSFNGALAPGDDRHRAVINTYFSLVASCIAAFIASYALSREHKFDMVHIQNATLAGGVAVGSTADMMIQPVGALVIGTIAGVLSVVGYQYLTPKLASKVKLHDTCGVHNLHGMPGVLGVLASVVAAGIASENDYGISLYQIFPARAPEQSRVNDVSNIELKSALRSGVIAYGDDRSAGAQAGMQLAALAIALVLAIVGGALTGLLLRLKIFDPVSKEAAYDDQLHWTVQTYELVTYEPLSTMLNVTDEHVEMKEGHHFEKEPLRGGEVKVVHSEHA